MSKGRIYARNLVANWIGFVVSLATVLFLSWFTFRYLGDARYGLWSLVVSLTGYFGMFDLGLRPALYRHFNWYLGRKETHKLNEVVCTGLAAMVVSTIVLIFGGMTLALLFPLIFPKIPHEFVPQAQVALVIIGANIGLSMISAVFACLIETHERYDLRAILDVLVSLVKAACGILALVLGFGMIGLAVGVLVSTGIACAGTYLISRHVFRSLNIRRSAVSRNMLWELIRFGIPCFFSGLGIRIILYTDALLIAWLIDLPSVGYYSLVVMLCEYGRSLVQKASTVFSPEIQQSIARNDLAGLRHFLPLVTRVTMVFGVLVIVGVSVFGHHFVGLFYGPAAGAAGRTVLPVLGLAYLAVVAAQPSFSLLIGSGQVVFLGFVLLGEAILNIALTIVFVVGFGMGFRGVALGTVVPMVLLSGLVVPAVAMRRIHLPLKTFAVRTTAWWISATVVFASFCLGVSHWNPVSNWGSLALGVLLAICFYTPLAWFLGLPRYVRGTILSGRSQKVGARDSVVLPSDIQDIHGVQNTESFRKEMRPK